MGALALPFVVLPCSAAVAAGYFLRDWRLAGAVAAGCFAFLIVLAGGWVPFSVFLLPVLGGVAVAALVLAPYLYLRPQASVWSRMSLSLAAALLAGLTLLYLSAGRD